VKKQDILENQANIAYLSLGSNLGKKKKNLELAKALLNSTGVKIICASSYYKTKSWPNKNFPDYLNAVILINTNNDLIELFKKIKTIEKKVGRTKSPKNYPRICDIDIIDFNGFCLSTSYKDNEITIPHKNMHNRSFVLLPLYEIDKNWIHPKYKKNIVNLLHKLSIIDLSSIKLM
tara:strand:- start:791 stop:1318 length:528 start_codon:yes stop_codon:yes gene_type:complete